MILRPTRFELINKNKKQAQQLRQTVWETTHRSHFRPRDILTTSPDKNAPGYRKVTGGGVFLGDADSLEPLSPKSYSAFDSSTSSSSPFFTAR